MQIKIQEKDAISHSLSHKVNKEATFIYMAMQQYHKINNIIQPTVVELQY